MREIRWSALGWLSPLSQAFTALSLAPVHRISRFTDPRWRPTS